MSDPLAKKDALTEDKGARRNEQNSPRTSSSESPSVKRVDLKRRSTFSHRPDSHGSSNKDISIDSVIPALNRPSFGSRTGNVHILADMDDNHRKLLYMISLYANGIENEETQRWILRVPLLVLIYEGIVQKAFDYDYAPSPEIIAGYPHYINISQEGNDDVDDLLENDFIRGLKLTAHGSQSVTAFQVTELGQDLLRNHLLPGEKESIDNFVYDVEHKELKIISLIEGKFYFHPTSVDPKGDESYESSVMDCEDVSYVSSPYLPQFLLAKDTVLRCNSSLAVQNLTTRSSNIRDELDEIIFLDEVKVLVVEWIPFGANQIVALNDKLGSDERVQGGLFTGAMEWNDHDVHQKTNIKFDKLPGLTSVRILDYDSTSYLNFEAEIHYSEDEGIRQVEFFGVHISEDGKIFYGLDLESIESSIKNRLSLDKLSRFLVDVHQDSSEMMDSLLTSYQRGLLDVNFSNQPENREKFNLIMAKRIDPLLSADKYMDKEKYENELKQVLGQTREAHNLSEEDVIIFGHHGILLCGPQSYSFEEIVCCYLSMMSRHIFLKNFFTRILRLDHEIKETRRMIDNHEKNPNSIPQIRGILSNMTHDIVLLEELLSYLAESYNSIKVPVAPESGAGKRLYELLGLKKLKQNQILRVRDMRKNIIGSRHALEGLRGMTDVISEARMFRMQEALQANTKNLEDVFRSGERTGSSLEVMQVILSGTLAFDILDRLTGEWSVAETPWASEWIVEPLMMKPGMWFIINIIMWGAIAYILVIIMNRLTTQSMGVLCVRETVNLPICIKNMQKFLARKFVEEESIESDHTMMLKKVSWTEENPGAWDGYTPKIELFLDRKNSYLLKVYMQIEKGASMENPYFFQTKLFRKLRAAGVIDTLPAFGDE